MSLFRNYLKKAFKPTTNNFQPVVSEGDEIEEEYTFDVVGESFQRDHLVQLIKKYKSIKTGELYTIATL